jgi:chaperonin GroEL
LIQAFEQLETPKDLSSDEQKGYDIVKKACFAPFKAIISNCGIEDSYSILYDIKEAKKAGEEDKTFTYDAKNHKVVDAFEVGLLDPAKVTRTALENAASVAGTILTTESVIFEKKEDKKEEDPMMGAY